MIYIALIGLTLIVARGTIFERLRRIWPGFFGCSQCVGMWIGMAAGANGLARITEGFWLNTTLLGGAVSVLALTVDAALAQMLGGDP